MVRRASNQGHQAAQQRIVGRPRLLLVEESGNSHPAPALTPRRCRYRIPASRPRTQKSYVAIDQPQMLNFYFNYEVPRFSFAQSGWKRLLFAGWTADGIFHYQSGFPIQVPNSTSTLTSVTFWQWQFVRIAFRARSSSCIASTATAVIPALRSFSIPLRGQTRLPEPTPLPSPSTAIIVARDIPASSWASARSSRLKEGVKFSLRADFFNVFNRWAYPNLNNTSNPFQTAQYASDGSISNGFGFFGTASPAQAETMLREVASLSRESSSSANSAEIPTDGKQHNWHSRNGWMLWSLGTLKHSKESHVGVTPPGMISAENEVGNHAT